MKFSDYVKTQTRDEQLRLQRYREQQELCRKMELELLEALEMIEEKRFG